MQMADKGEKYEIELPISIALADVAGAPADVIARIVQRIGTPVDQSGFRSNGLSPSTSTGESDWVLVPREPAVNMRHVGGEVVEERQGHSTPRDLAAAVYREMVMAASLHTPRAMLASAPAPDPFVDDEPISPGMQAVIDGTKAKIREAFAPAPDTKQEPVAWRVKDFADGWGLFHSEAEARREAGAGNLVQALFPSPVTQKVSEAMVEAAWRVLDGMAIVTHRDVRTALSAALQAQEKSE